MSNADDRSIARWTLIVIGLVLATLVGLALMWETRRVLIWLVVAVFLAVALNPLVDWVQRRFVRRRAVATLVVFVAIFVALVALGVLVVVPLADDWAGSPTGRRTWCGRLERGRGRSVNCWSASTCGGTPRPMLISSGASAASSASRRSG